MRKLLRKLIWKAKAILRDWLFADYKWVTRAQVQREICALQWIYRDHRKIVSILNDLKETIR